MKDMKVSRFLLCLLALAAVLLVYFNFALPPLLGAGADLDREHETNAGLMKTYDGYLADLDRLKNGSKELETKISAARDPAPSPEEISRDVNDALKAEGLTADKLSVGDGAPVQEAEKLSSGKTLSSVDVQLELQCPQQKLTALLSRFDKNRGYYVSSLEWSAGSGGMVSASVTLSLYYYADNAASSAGKEASK